ncbi:hypothetical protein BpHYR1_011121 [Brachionus plicatilis]|uniref:Uncharacterized protein n=1 Tax=Brachionus plicatilis TaxID=10195 RepID=A0A3M7RA83_BRAPC|nr:hypothetical protein BpHYR1_011121 [Brachionus plicatilis]
MLCAGVQVVGGVGVVVVFDQVKVFVFVVFVWKVGFVGLFIDRLGFVAVFGLGALRALGLYFVHNL